MKRIEEGIEEGGKRRGKERGWGGGVDLKDEGRGKGERGYGV